MSKPTNGELKIMFDNLKETFEDKHKDVMGALARIESHTSTLGKRVISLEKSRIQVWTAISVLTLLGGIIIGLSVMAIDSKIQKGIAQALEENVEKITPAE